MLGRELGTHWADFGNVEPNPHRTMPWSRSASAIHSTADQGSVVTLVSLCEGFRTTARCDSAGRHRGRRPKASREGTRGELRCGMCHALWRFERPTKASLFWTILCVIRPEPLGRGFGSGNASIEPTTSSRSALRDRPLSFASRHRAEHSTAPSAACH